MVIFTPIVCLESVEFVNLESFLLFTLLIGRICPELEQPCTRPRQAFLLNSMIAGSYKTWTKTLITANIHDYILDRLVSRVTAPNVVYRKISGFLEATLDVQCNPNPQMAGSVRVRSCGYCRALHHWAIWNIIKATGPPRTPRVEEAAGW